MSTKSKVPPLNGINDSSNDTPNNTTSSAAVATKEEEEEEDIYQALDELRVLTKYSIQNLTMFHRWYCTYVNPRQAPALHGASIEQFASTFRNASPDNPTVAALFKRFQRPNGVADMLEVFAGMCVICDGTTSEKVDFLFHLFDFAGKGNIVEDEATLMLECVAGAFTTIGLIVMPMERDLEFASGWIYTDRNTGETRGSANVEDFRKWVKNSPAAGEILEMLNCVPVVEELLSRFHKTVTEFVQEVSGGIEEELDYLGGDAGFGVLSNVKFRDDVRILVGPIIGTVTSTTVVILLEVDKDCDVNILLCLAGGYDESSVTLLPPAPESLGSGPGRAGGPRERLVRVQPLPLVACRPRSVQIQGLTPNAMYRIHVAGVAPDDSATRIGSFRTLSRGSGIGVSRLLQHRFFRNRYHMQPVEDRDTYGGVATGPTEDGLTLVALSGCSNREMQSSEKGSDGGEGGEEEEEYPSSNSNRNDISRNGDRATSAGVNETSLWKILWETTIRPSRCDLIVHAGGQVSVTSAVKNAVVLFNRYSRQDDEGETVAVTGERGGGAGSGFEEVSTIQTNNKIRGKRAQQAKLEREAKEEQKRLELIIDRERKIAEDDDDHMNQLNREHPFHPHLPPPPTTPRTILNDKGEEVDFDDHFKSNLVDVLSNENGEEQIAAEEGKRRRSRTSSFGGMDFSGLNDGITTLLKSEKDLKKRVQFRKALFKGVETKETMSIVREHAMELIRDSYRRSFNLLYTRECLAHCSNMMCLGEEEINIGEDGKASAESIVLLKMCRRAYWEYQRQLWDVDCIKRSDDFQRRKERREYRMRKRSASMVDKDENKEKEEKIELRKKEGKVDGKSEEREIVVSLNNDEEEENKVIELRTWEIPLITEKKKRVLHEGRYVRAGNIGMLYVDAVGPRLSRQLDGSYNNKNIDNCDPIGEAQFQFISDQLNQSKMKHEGGEYGEGENNSIKCLVVVLHTPLTGRRHEKGSSSDSSRDVFANPSGQSSICRLIDMLFQWMSGKRRIVRVISGDNGVGPACEGELLDRLANRVRIQWISVGPMSARVLGAPPHDDPRSIEWQMRYGRNKKTSKRSKVEYPLTIKGRTLLSTDQGEQQPSWMPDIVWGAKPLWERRNYAVVRVFQGNESKDPGVKRPDGDPSLSKWFMHPDECRVETAIIPSHVAKNPSITLGPIIGTVTDTSAVIMIEIDHDAVVVCICRDILSNQERIATLCTSTTTTIVTSGIGGRDGLSGKVVRGNRPHVFLAEHLAPGRKYSVYFRGISNDSTNRRGSFVTLPKSTNQGSHVRLLVASTDHPHLLSNLQVNGYELINGGIASHHRDVMLPPKSTWESVWRDQLLGRWSGASSMLRLGGQVWLRGMVETQLSSVLESYRGDVFENILHLLYQVRQTATLPLTTKNLDGDVKSAPINIGDSSSGIVALQRGPAWTSSNLSVGAIPAGQERNEDAFETDEDGTTGNSNVPGLGINVGAAWSKYDQLCETIAETFRKVYRDAWNVPYLRQVLANCPQTMIPGGSDLACGFDVWKNSHEQRVFGPVVMGIALDVQIEYQHQLNEPYVLCSTGNTITGKKRQANHRATSTRMGTVQNVLLLTLDLWSNRISTGGSDGGHDDTSAKKRGRHVRGKLFEPDKPLLSDQQWKFLEDELKSLEKEDDEHKRKIKMEKEQSKSNNSGTGIRGTMVEMGEEEEDEEIPSTPVGIVDTIIIASDLPFTGRTPAEVDQLERSRPPSWSKDDWSCREQEYVRLLSMMFKWKGRSRDCRDVWFVCGGSSLTPAGECYITDVSTGMRLRQVTVGPATGLPTGALPEREIHFGKGGYTRTPVSRTFFRNYGVVHVRPPASLLVGRPGSSQSGRPSTRGSAWTSSSSRNKNVIKSRTRISLVTQSNFSRGDAHPLPPAEMTPRWWIAKTGSHPYADSVGRSRPGTTGTGPGSSIVPSGPPLLADRRSMMETVQEMEKEDEGKRKMEKDNQLQVMEAVNDYSRRGDRGKDIGGLGGGLDGGFMGLEALGLDTSGLIMDGGGRGTFYEEIRKRNVVENASVLVSWARDQMKKCLQDDATTQAAIEYVYRRYYLQVERLSDSVFYEDIAERIYGMMPVLGNNFDEMSNDYNNNNEDTYNDILSDLQLKINEMKSFEPGIREERMIVQLKHDAIVSTYQTNYDSKLRIERKKREIYYHVEGRLGDCQTAIVTATTRAGYPKRKGGQTALRVELHERKIEIDRRADRRERNRIKFEAKKGEVLTCKKESDFIMEMEIEEIKEEKRLSPVHVDDAARSKIAQAVIAMATFVQSAGIPKKKRKKMSKELANEAKTIMREQNVVRLQRNEVMLVNITDETPDAIALLQQFYQERVDLLQEEENEKLRDHRAKMSWLKERIDLLTEIDEQVTELEAECVVLREELEIRKEELRIATENRMQAQLELKDKKNDRRVALQVFDKQLSTLEEQLALGDVTSFVGRVESAVLYLWNEEPTGRALPKSIKKILPDLGNGFVLAHCLDNAFFTEIGGGDRGRSRPPMDPNAFYRCITEVVLQGAVLKAALTLPSE